MALPSSGTLKFSQILAEFGDTPPKKLSDYYGLLGVLPTSGLLSLSDFYGLSSAPAPTYTWYGSFKMRPGRIETEAGSGTYIYGYRTTQDLNGDPRPGGGSVLDSYQVDTGINYAWMAWGVQSQEFWNAAGNSGFEVSKFTLSNFSNYSPQDVDRVEYTVFDGATVVGSGRLGSESYDRGTGNKYGTRYLHRVGGTLPNTGILAGHEGMGQIMKYCYDRGYDIEITIIVP